MKKDNPNFKIDDGMAEMMFDRTPPDPKEAGSPPGGKAEEPSIDDIRFDIKPEVLIKYLNDFVVGQNEAIETIATKICTHFHRMQLERNNSDLPRILGHVKGNMLLIGSTGVGKTYLIKLIADKLNVPFVKGDATKFSETGYVGGDVEDLIRELVHQVGGNIKLAEYGIVYIDEIDKIASSGSVHGPDVSRSGVQRNLLKLMEETEVDMKVPHDLASQMEAVIETQRTGKAKRKKINTRNILFVMSGAFNNLPLIISRRLRKGGFGFSDQAMASSEDIEFLLSKLHAQDLIDYGFESEFVGRVPVLSSLRDLDEDGLFQILSNPQSAVVRGKKRDFAAYGIKLEFDDEAFRFIAKKALPYKTGARGLVSVVEELLLPFERSLPSTSINKLVITKEVCDDPEGELKKMIEKYAFDRFATNFVHQTGIHIQFSPSAQKLASESAENKGVSLLNFLEECLNNYDYGLKLVGKDSFNVTTKVLQNPQQYLNNLVKRNYQED